MSFFEKEIKKLGFGLMRLPKKGDVIDIEQVKDMVDAFMEAGFTYFDTAWAYAGSEDAIRQALVERYPRESYQLATKNAAWINCKTREDAIRQFETSLERTGAGYFDMYLLHNLGEHRTHFFEAFDLWEFVKEKKAEGKIRHYGFSFHSTPEELEDILQKHPDAEFIQLQINYADWENPAIQSRGIYEVARKYGKPVVIWGTLSMGSPRTSGRWYVRGCSYPRYINLHCMVLTGYDKKKDLVYVADPLSGNVTYRLSTTRIRYAQMGSRAVVIR